MARIVETNNFSSDHPDEKFLNIPELPEPQMRRIANAINDGFPAGSKRYWKVVENDYTLNPDIER
ncbi:MAG: hypothetical protein KDG50_07125 [Chromatiales bacterium]|nr:hypothetical protein [Chromatiales bacterium]